MWTKSFALLLMLTSWLSQLVSCQDTIGCFTEGECQGGVSVGVAHMATPVECLAFCQDNIDCQFFTHYDFGKGTTRTRPTNLGSYSPIYSAKPLFSSY